MKLVDDIGGEVRVVAHDDGFFCTRLELQNPDYRDLDLFDFGYALTAYKAQGSEWGRVVVIDETGSPGFTMISGNTPAPEFKRRWLYTAVTRARSSVVVTGAPR